MIGFWSRLTPSPGARRLFLVAVVCLPLAWLPFTEQLDGRFSDRALDRLLAWSSEPPLSSELILVGLDEKSIRLGYDTEDLQLAAERLGSRAVLVSDLHDPRFVRPQADNVVREVSLFLEEDGSFEVAPVLQALLSFRGEELPQARETGFAESLFWLQRSWNGPGSLRPVFRSPPHVSRRTLLSVGGLDLTSPILLRHLEPISLADLDEIEDRIGPRLVLMGRTLRSADDWEYTTPTGSGVHFFFYASLLDAMLQGRVLALLPPLLQWTLNLSVLALLCLLLSGRRGFSALGCWLLLLVSWLVFDQALAFGGFVGQPGFVVLSSLVILLVHLLLQSQLAADLLWGLGGETLLTKGEEQGEATICFLSLPDSIKELEASEPHRAFSVRQQFNQKLGQLSEACHGRVLDLQGDALMIAFGLESPVHHSHLALKFALDSVRELEGLMTKLLPDYGAHHRVFCGLVCGEVAQGQVGGGEYRAVAAIGDTTNSAARLMGMAKKNEASILIDQNCLDRVQPRAQVESFGEVRVKGKAEPIPSYRLLSLKTPPEGEVARPRFSLPRAPMGALIVIALGVGFASVFLDSLLPLGTNLRDSLMESEQEGHIVWAGIDEESLARQPWPWPRGLHAQVIENCFEAGAAAIFYDVVFDLPSEPDQDEFLAQSLELYPQTVLAAALRVTDGGALLSPELWEPFFRPGQWGLIDALEADDGLIRDAIWEVRGFSDQSDLVAPGVAKAVLLASDPEGHLPRPEGASFLIRWGPEPEPLSYFRFLDPEDPLFSEIKGAVIVVGDSLAEDSDVVSTPFGKKKGPLVHALSIQTLQTESMVCDLSYSLQSFTLLLLSFLGILYLSLVLREFTEFFLCSFLVGAAILAVVVSSVTYFGVYLGVLPLLGVALAAPGGALLRFSRVSSILKSYVPSKVQQALENGSQVTHRKGEATILLTDIRGYTALSEGRGPTEILGILNRFHELTAEVYKRWGGHLLTYQGDAQIIVFGALDQLSNPPLAAYRAASELEAIAAQVAEEAGLESPDSLRVGAGITTGFVTVGLIKAGRQFQYTVVGEPVRRAHRLQALSDAVGSPVILDPESARLLRDQVSVRTLSDGESVVALIPRPKDS